MVNTLIPSGSVAGDFFGLRRSERLVSVCDMMNPEMIRLLCQRCSERGDSERGDSEMGRIYVELLSRFGRSDLMQEDGRSRESMDTADSILHAGK